MSALPDLIRLSVQKVFDDLMEAVGIIAGGRQKLRLLGDEGPDFSRRHEMKDHARRGERCFKLVRDQRKKIVLHFVQPPQSCHVGKDNGCAHHLGRVIQYEDGARQEEAGLAVQLDLDGRLVVAQFRPVARRRNLPPQGAEPLAGGTVHCPSPCA